MINRVVRGFTSFYKDDYEEFCVVKDFCYTRNILEKVIVDVVINKSEFLKGGKILTEESVFEHPNIPKVFSQIISLTGTKKADKQCK